MEVGRSWISLLWLLASLHNTSAQMVRCDVPADVIFLLDASASIKADEWRQEKQFVGVLVDSLEVEPDAINVGLIVYSTEIGQVVDLQPFKTRQQLKAQLPLLVQTSQGTDTARAIARMRRMMQNQARDDAKKIAVLITDGRSENSTTTIQEAVYARQLDRVTMVALGVGNETYIDELQAIAKSDYDPDQNLLFTVRNFAELQFVVEELRNLICEAVPITTTTTTPSTTTSVSLPPIVTPDIPPIACPRPADVVFLVDASHSISDLDWARGRVFVSSLIKSLEVDIDAIHVGIVVYSSDIGDTVPLKPFLGKAALMAKAATLTQPPLGRTNTALGLRAVRAMFRNQGRAGVPHIGIVITDGKSLNVQETMTEAFRAKRDGVVMLVVGVGDDTLPTELNAITSSPDTLFNVTDFSALFDITVALRKRICIATDTTTSPSTITTTTPGPVIPDMCKECLVAGGVGYNSYPPDCTKYVVCYPETNGGYRAEVKNCPFGLYWSSTAVACLDAIYVSCNADPCLGQWEGRGHTEGTRGCGEHWVCRGGRSHPQCCPPGQRYSDKVGCLPDAGCTDKCSLQWTVAGSGACPYRPKNGDSFSYLQFVPGKGHMTKPCSPGKLYDHNQCACVFFKPSVGCLPLMHYNFDGNFNDKSTMGHSGLIERVLLSRRGAAYFNGTSQIRVDTVPRNAFHDKLVLRLRYRVRPEKEPLVQWNDHYDWGLQNWFSTNIGLNNLTFQNGKLPSTEPAPNLPSGQSTSTLEEIVILHNGTVLYGGGGGTGSGQWPGPGSAGEVVSRVHLGPMADITETAVSGGVVYVPSSHVGQVLVHSPKTGTQDLPPWQIVSVDGAVLKSGEGEVPARTAARFNLQLHPEPTTRWFFMTSTGYVLHAGTGLIPEEIKNRYAGFSAGKLLKVKEVGDRVVEWSVSKPDGSQATGGKGPIPEALRQQLKLDDLLKAEGGAVKRWAVLADTGDVLESGTGDVTPALLSKYSRLRSGLVLTDGDTHWQLQRTDGTSLVEGQGTLPAGVTAFIRGSAVLPTLVQTSTWTVVLPNGTRMSGEGPIPDHVQRLFDQQGSAIGGGGGGGGGSTAEQSRWYVTDGTGNVLESGFGDLPTEVAQKTRNVTNTKVVRQMMTSGSEASRWEVKDQDGTTLASGSGQPPADVFKVLTETKPTNVGVQGSGSGTITSGANYPGFRVNSVPSDTGPKIDVSVLDPTGQGQARLQGWTIVMPDGSLRSGEGQIPASIQSVLSGGQGAMNRWTLTLPDGSTHSGQGRIPADILAKVGRKVSISGRVPSGDVNTLLGRRGTGSSTGGGLVPDGSRSWDPIRRWSVTLPDGTVRTGTGDIPADLKPDQNQSGGLRPGLGSGLGAGLGGATGGTLGGSLQRKWTVTLPDGTVRSGTGEIPADLQALIDAQNQAGGNLGRGVQRKWTVNLPDGTVRSGVGQIPADLQALIDAQKERRGSGSSLGGLQGSVAGTVQRKWSITMPNGTVRTGTGDVPADLQALLTAQREAGTLRTQRRWTVTLPDGKTRSGVGEMPPELLRATRPGGGAWRVPQPDGQTQGGAGPIPADLASLMETFRNSGSPGNRLNRRRRAAQEEPYRDVVGNCGGGESPSFVLATTPRNVRLALRTTAMRKGTFLTLPISPGMNVVEFQYDGKSLSGFSSDVQKSLPLTGFILPAQGPITIGKCRGTSPGFRGEIDEISLFSCIR